MASLFAHLGSRAGRKAEDKDDDLDEAEKARKAKKAKADEEDSEDDEDDEDEEGNKKDKKDRDDAKASAARGRERARVRAILTSGPGLANPVVAAHMALDTDMPRGSAVLAIESLNTATGIPDADEVSGSDANAAMAKAILSAGAKARGENPAAAIPPGRRERMGVREGAAPPPPRQDMAAAIIDAGRRARGEI